jgi:hypothetical protein
MIEAASPLHRPTLNCESAPIEATSRSGFIGKLVTWELDPKRSCCCSASFKSAIIFFIKKAFVVLDFIGIGSVCYRLAFPFLDNILGIKIHNLASAKGFQADWNQCHRSSSATYEIFTNETRSQTKEEMENVLPLSSPTTSSPEIFLRSDDSNDEKSLGGKCSRHLTELVISTTQTLIDRTSGVIETLDYIKQILANPKSQKNPKAFMQEWVDPVEVKVTSIIAALASLQALSIEALSKKEEISAEELNLLLVPRIKAYATELDSIRSELELLTAKCFSKSQ